VSSERTPALPLGWFDWIRPFCRVPDTHVLNHSSLDGYLFLRYLKVLIIICLVGCCITFPILLPLNILGGNNGFELDLLTFGNVGQARWLFAHAAVAVVYFCRCQPSIDSYIHVSYTNLQRLCALYDLSGVYLFY
jgi:hypothetical protein